MLLTELHDEEPLGLRLLRNLFAKGVSIQLDILDAPKLLIRHFFSPDDQPVSSYIQNVFITSVGPCNKDGTLTIWADNGFRDIKDYVATIDGDFDSLLTLVKRNNQWVLTNAPD